MSIQSPECLCSTVTKPVCGDQSAVSSPRASCPARQRRPLLSQRKAGGGFTAPCGPGSPHPPPPPSLNLPATPLQRSATGASVSTGSQVHKYLNPLPHSSTDIHVSITRLQSCMCSNMLSNKQLSITFLILSICERTCRYSYKLTGISPAADSARRTHFTWSGSDSDNGPLITFETWTERTLLFVLSQQREREGEGGKWIAWQDIYIVSFWLWAVDILH